MVKRPDVSRKLKEYWTPERRKAHSQKLLGHKLFGGGSTGHTLSQEAKKKIGMARVLEHRAIESLRVTLPGEIFYPNEVCDAIYISPEGRVVLIEAKSRKDVLRPKQSQARQMTTQYTLIRHDEAGRITSISGDATFG